AYGLAFYVWKTVLPLQLSPLYPMPTVVEPAAATFLAAYAVVIALTVLACATPMRRRFPGLPWGWLLFVVELLPLLGVVQNGYQIAADRYTYQAGAVAA